jgi:hypothetical protein
MTDKELEQIRRRYDEFSPLKPGTAYRAFMTMAHSDVGRLLNEVDRLKAEAGRTAA